MVHFFEGEVVFMRDNFVRRKEKASTSPAAEANRKETYMAPH